MQLIRRHRWRALFIVAALVATTVAGLDLGEAQTPTFFVRLENGTVASLDTTAYTLRMFGDDRFLSAASMATVAAVDKGGPDGYPFSEASDRTDPAAAYSSGACPTTVGLAAADTPADALAASSAYGATLQGVPRADNGTLSSLSTANAVMLLTTSARQGGSSAPLSTATNATLNKIRAACANNIPNGIIFGGPSAVSESAELTFDAFVGTVYRIEGPDRFETAADVARAVVAGIGGVPDITIWDTATTTRNLADTVILAEGFTGADALAIGPYAADRNIPILLTPTGSLPAATQNALLDLKPKNIIVVGGTAAISDVVVTAAKNAAGAGSASTRVAAADRYASSVEISKRLLGYWPELAKTDNVANGQYSNLGIGLARSEGSSNGHVGWPDALSSAWWLAQQDDVSANPSRVAPPWEKNDSAATIGGADNGQPPLLLTQSTTLPGPVAAYLAGLWPDSAKMLTATNPSGTDHGGFGFVFGGPSAVGVTVEQAFAQLLSGGSYVAENRTDLKPVVVPAGIFYTPLDLTTYAAGNETVGGVIGAVAAGPKVCGFTGSLNGSHDLVLYEVDGQPISASLADHQNGNVNSSRTPYVSRFVCAARPGTGGDATDDNSALIVGQSLSGHDTSVLALDWNDPAKRLSTTTAGGDSQANSASASPFLCSVFSEGTSTCTLTATFSGPLQVNYRGTEVNTASFSLNLAVQRIDSPAGGDQVDAVIASGSLTVNDGGTQLFTANLGMEASSLGPNLLLVGEYAVGSSFGAVHLTLTPPPLLSVSPGLIDLAIGGLLP